MKRFLLILVLLVSSLPLSGSAESKDGTTSIQTVEETTTNAGAPTPPASPPLTTGGQIEPGNTFRVRLLASVNAPTDGTPYPVIMKVLSDVADPESPLAESRIIAAAQASLQDSRVLFRLKSLHLRLKSGKRKIVDIDGWVVGDDGIRGIKGQIIDPLGKTMAFDLASSVSGIGKGPSEGTPSLREESPIDCTNFSYASGKGNNGAACAEKIIRARAAQYVPQVQVLSGVEAIVVFSKGLDIKELLNEGETSHPQEPNS